MSIPVELAAPFSQLKFHGIDLVEFRLRRTIQLGPTYSNAKVHYFLNAIIQNIEPRIKTLFMKQADAGR